MKQNLYRGKLTDRFKDLKNLRPDLVEKGIVKDSWIYGSLITDEESGRTYICTHATCSHNTYINNGIVTMFEVIPETVGQYIGVADRNNTMVFENDIIKTQPFRDKPFSLHSKTKQHIGAIKYRADKQGTEWYVEIDDYGKYTNCVYSELFNCEVIGNLHDSPKLLKGEN